MSTSDPTRMLVVGLVRGSSWARQIAKMPEVEVAGLVDVDATRMSALAEELSVPADSCHTDYQQALRSVRAEIVVLAVPTPLHYDMSVAGLRTGHHVICEKPLAMTMDEARRLRDEVRRYDHRFMVGEQYRFADGVENLRRAIADGRIGRLGYIDHEFRRGAHLSMGKWGQTEHWSQRYEEAALHDMSVHHFDMWYFITGSPCAEITVKSFDVAWNTTNRKFGHSVYATLRNGAHVHYLTCRALARPQTTWYGLLDVVGEDGALSWNGDGAEVTLTRTAPTANPMDQTLENERIAYVERGTGGTNDTLVLLIRSLLDAVREGRPHPCDIDDNMASFATSMAAVESARTGKTVLVETA